MKRIGIFSGTFDPIHVGHIEACLVAKGALELDQVLVMIEKQPKRKTNVTPYYHRQRMVELALDDFSTIKFYDVPSANITFKETLARLVGQFPQTRFVMIIGSDMLGHLPSWPDLDYWLGRHTVAVVLRDNQDEARVKDAIVKLKRQFNQADITILPAVRSPVSSSKIRRQIARREPSEAIHRRVQRYIEQNNLYSS